MVPIKMLSDRTNVSIGELTDFVVNAVTEKYFRVGETDR